MATNPIRVGSGSEKMKLKSLLLRYYPPGIMLEYEKSGELKTKSIDLLDLHPSTDVNALVEEIQRAEPLITASRSDQVKLLIRRLQEKLGQHSNHKFSLFKVLRAHILPLTNVALNKSGSCFITGSYDRTCKVWNTASGEELLTLDGHRNVVYAIAFNNPYGDKIATGSFDKTCKLWNAETGACYHTFRGHTAEIVCLSFNPQSTLVATGSMDTTSKLWDIQNGEEVFTLTGHSAEIISLSFNTLGDRIITGSFDHTAVVWDTETGRKVYTVIGHCAEISTAMFNWDCSMVLTGSMDKTCMEQREFSVQPPENALLNWKVMKVRFQRFPSTPKGTVFSRVALTKRQESGMPRLASASRRWRGTLMRSSHALSTTKAT
uniref:Dynein assembly factor with WD repeats 1 n=1 Tax=Molossus molossus TaxID=27622 RepID=A0A7J8FR33_MOLMO|nr:dynein assembly factor with WD repeats 1 [Molossus molossus]